MTSLSAALPLNPWMRISLSIEDPNAQKVGLLFHKGVYLSLYFYFYAGIICFLMLYNSVFHHCPCFSQTANLCIHFLSVNSFWSSDRVIYDNYFKVNIKVV